MSSSEAAPPSSPKGTTQLGARQQIACPHCEARYPLVQQLLGRSLRCRECKGAFRVLADGRVQPVIGGELEKALKEGGSQRSTESGRVKPLSGANEAALKRRDQLSRTTMDLRKASTRMQRLAQEALGEPDDYNPNRASTASVDQGTLKAALLESQARRAARKPSTTARDQRKTSSIRRPSETARHSPALTRSIRRERGGVGDISPAIVTGEGEREQKRRRWWVLALVIIAVVLGAIVASVGSSPQAAALRAFSADASGGYAPSRRIIQLQQRSLGGAAVTDPIISLAGARIGSVNDLPVAGLTALAAEWVSIDGGKWWTAPAHSDRIRQELLTSERSASDIQADGVPLRDRKQMTDAVASIFGAEAAEIAILLLSMPDSEARPTLQRQLANGVTPLIIEWCRFSGSDGSLLLDYGEPLTTAYRGHLVRIEGAGWDGTWQVVQIRAY